MSVHAESVALRLAVRGLVAVIVVLAAIPLYLTLAPDWRPLAARLTCAILVVVACTRLLRSVRRALDEEPPSALELAPVKAPAPELDERFVRLRDEVRFSVRSRRYFDGILWPHLSRLGGVETPPPAERRRLRHDGPSLRTIERLVAAAESGR